MEVPVIPEIKKDITTQSYPPHPQIEGVAYRPLKKHRVVEGWFMEYMRLCKGQIENLDIPFDVRQLSFSFAAPARINAFHVHVKEVQDELWCVIRGSLLVWLVDLRANSSTSGAKHSYLLTDEQPAFLYIPSGVAHGYKTGHRETMLMYAMNNQFNPDNPNEGRLPWDYFGAELWTEDKG